MYMLHEHICPYNIYGANLIEVNDVTTVNPQHKTLIDTQEPEHDHLPPPCHTDTDMPTLHTQTQKSTGHVCTNVEGWVHTHVYNAQSLGSTYM